MSVRPAPSAAAETDMSGLFNLPEPKEATRLITLNMPVSLINELDALAKKSGNNRTKLINHFCQAALAQLKAEEEAAAPPPRNSRK